MERSTEELRSEVLQNTLQQISSLACREATECCVICLGELVERCEAQPCQHSNFDYICLVTWLQEHPTCPLCKSNVHEVRYDLSEDGIQSKIYKVPEPSERPANATERSSRSASLSQRQSSSNAEPLEHTLRRHEDESIRRRRFIYQHNLYSLHVGSNRRQPASSRYKELSPQLFLTDIELVSRARTWLYRELRVFEFLYTNDDPPDDHDPFRRPRPSKAEFLLEYIIAILKTVDIQGSTGQAEEMIQELLGRRFTRLFLHELKAWLRSPYRSLSAWDNAVQYSGENTLPRASQDIIREPESTAPLYPDSYVLGCRTEQSTSY